MGKRLRNLIERVLYVGIKPGVLAPPAERYRWLGPLKKPIEQYLSGGSSTDPLYLTHRTPRQKIMVAAVVVVPFLIVATVLILSATGSFSSAPARVTNLTPAEIAQKMLPDLNKVEAGKPLEITVTEVHFDRGANPSLSGTLKNTTNRTIYSGDVVFDLGNAAGSQVGRVTAHVENLAPQATAQFRVPNKEPTATFALVREVTTH